MQLPFAVSVQLLVLPLLVAAQGLKRSISLKEHTEYRDFVPLSAANLTQLVMQDEQAWVIHVHDGFLDPDVKHRAGQVRGLIRFGLVSIADKDALDLMKFDPTKHFFRALPFGWESRKRAKFLDTEGFAVALAHADDSVPGDLLNPVTTEQETKAVLAEGIMSKPSRFTVLFTVEDDKATLLHRVLSRKLIRNFNFALLTRAGSKEVLKATGLGRLTIAVPGMSVLTVTKTGQVRSSRMADSSNLQFADALRFLVEFNRQFRPDLPGDARSTDRKVLYMSDILDAERLIFQVEDAASQASSEQDKKPDDPATQAGTIGEDLNEEL